MRELDENVKQELLAPFQSAEVKVRTSPYVAPYVTARVVQARLDQVLPFQWSFELLGKGELDSKGVMSQDGSLFIHTREEVILKYQDRGSAAPDQAKGQAKQSKAAVSDCFKRCAVMVGIFRYGYFLENVTATNIPKVSVDKALAAVGYKGDYDERHYGRIGGMRQPDLEDEPEEVKEEEVITIHQDGVDPERTKEARAELKEKLVSHFSGDNQKIGKFLQEELSETLGSTPKISQISYTQARILIEKLTEG